MNLNYQYYDNQERVDAGYPHKKLLNTMGEWVETHNPERYQDILPHHLVEHFSYQWKDD